MQFWAKRRQSPYFQAILLNFSKEPLPIEAQNQNKAALSPLLKKGLKVKR